MTHSELLCLNRGGWLTQLDCVYPRFGSLIVTASIQPSGSLPVFVSISNTGSFAYLILYCAPDSFSSPVSVKWCDSFLVFVSVAEHDYPTLPYFASSCNSFCCNKYRLRLMLPFGAPALPWNSICNLCAFIATAGTVICSNFAACGMV
jgi:hypothetical protein